MFRCRTSSVSAASLLRVNFTVYSTGDGGTTRALRHHRAVCCSSVYRRLPDCKAAVSCRSGYITLVGCERGVPCTSLFDTPYALNATQKHEFGDWTNRDHRRVCEANEPFSSVRQMRGASTTPEKTQERAAGVEAEPLSSGSSAQGPGSDEKPSKAQQLRKVFKEYGAVGVSFHIGISLMSLGIFYSAVSSGIDMTSVLCKMGFSESLVQSKMAAGTSTFVLAYAVHKLFAPVRISITLVSVPLIVRHLRRTGLFKPRTSAP
ncbi:protein FAM210B, mitochondrial [Triplophysa rosa]|uniref:Protein FAM210B n=1 Tax=Triplophysa rosa TaxID=992332 RepID=A0A9W7WT72_TRIRA|nr:protein FAM210B, mitochondrial [Triplophysa rosa]KAI7808185.1 protein FAM210B [Triplophysa rosa]